MSGGVRAGGLSTAGYPYGRYACCDIDHVCDQYETRNSETIQFCLVGMYGVHQWDVAVCVAHICPHGLYWLCADVALVIDVDRSYGYIFEADNKKDLRYLMFDGDHLQWVLDIPLLQQLHSDATDV